MYMYDMSNVYLYFWDICNFKLFVRWRGLGDIIGYKLSIFWYYYLESIMFFFIKLIGFFLKLIIVFISILLLSIWIFFV